MDKNGKKGEAKYKHPSGRPIEYHTDDLEEFVRMAYHGLSCLIELLNGSDHEELSFAGTALSDLLEHAEEQLEKKVKFIEENLGKISIDVAEGEIGVAPDSLLGLNFTPKTHEAAKGQA